MAFRRTSMPSMISVRVMDMFGAKPLGSTLYTVSPKLGGSSRASSLTQVVPRAGQEDGDVLKQLAAAAVAATAALTTLRVNQGQRFDGRANKSARLKSICFRTSSASTVSVHCQEQPGISDLSFENVAKLPLPGTAGPGKVSFVPSGGAVTFLAAVAGGLRRELQCMDISTGEVKEVCRPPSESGEEQHFTLEEKLRRERAREMFTGITTYQWARECDVMLVPLAGDLYVQQGVTGSLRRVCGPNDLHAAAGAILDPRLSADAKQILFVCDKELYIVSSDGSTTPKQLTSGARGTSLSHGLADFLAQEELDRYEGYWLSNCGNFVAFEQVDESHIPIYRIVHQGSDAVGDGAQEDHHYPFAGDVNPKVRFGVAQTKGEGTITWFDGLTQYFGQDGYLARVNWLPNGSLAVQVLNREQTKLVLLLLDPQTGSTRPVLIEESHVWVNLHNMFRPLKQAPEFIWASERNGFQHLYKYDLHGNMLQQLTTGEWMVESVESVDEERGLIYFTGNRGSWLERHLFVMALNGGDAQQITLEPGMHSTVVDIKGGHFVDTYSASTHPLRVEIRSLEDGSLVRNSFAAEDPRLKSWSPAPWEFFTVPSTDQRVMLQAAVLKPHPDVHGHGPHPTIVSVYGGPHVQTVQNAWLNRKTAMREQILCQRGFVVLKVDNRGSARRGLEFEGGLKHDMGNVEVADQVAGVQKCVELGYTDPARVGIMGWSYGGYMSAMCLVKEPTVFKAAVSGAPVTHWDGYDTAYTERYMGLPQGNPGGYARSAIMPYVDNLSGHLLLVHGLIDENVHFRHTARLINALIKARKTYQLLLFPNERHSPRSLQDRIYMEEQVCTFLERSLRAQ